MHPGRQRSESVRRLATRSWKAGARRLSSSADSGSTVRPRTRWCCIYTACTLHENCMHTACTLHAYSTHTVRSDRRDGAALHMHIYICTSTWQIMLMVNTSRMIERRLNKIARLHARQHGQTLAVAAAAEPATCGSRRPRTCARQLSGLRGRATAALSLQCRLELPPRSRHQTCRLRCVRSCRQGCMPTAPGTSEQMSTSPCWSS